MLKILRKLGPGILFAGAAIGVSHLVQSTRAGAEYGIGLLWAMVLVNLFKYPFFEFGPRYTGATGESLLDGYKRLGSVYIYLYFMLSLATMFTIQTAVTIVTAGIANALLGDVNVLLIASLGLSGIEVWTILILLISLIILIIGKYKALDKLIKIIIILLSISTLIAVISASSQFDDRWGEILYWPQSNPDLIFLIAFMGWMPAPIDVSVFHSLWTEKKLKSESQINLKDILLDFKIGYLTTFVIGILFLLLGFLVMFGHGRSFGNSAIEFANQLIGLYTESLGNWSSVVIAIAALTAMFSTTITTLDASPRAMARTTQLLLGRKTFLSYFFWLVVLSLGTIMIFVFLESGMLMLVKVATILSFITAPIYAALNFKLVCSRFMPKESQPGKLMRGLSWFGLVFLIVFSLIYMISFI